ncbi:MAG: hypothetical protein OXM57_05260 [bacterium]|nr:hypothetical protein [bacterium]MDE0352077.1 hypothetical protein [bacterium]
MTGTGLIRTVLGDVAPEPWGITNAHAHLVGVPDTSKPPFDTTDASELTMTLDDSLPELEDFAGAGGFCLVDLTPAGMGRDPAALVRASEQTGMHIVMGTGIYHHAHHPGSIAGLDEAEIAEMLVRDIVEGVDGTGVRAGIIGEQGTFTGPMTEREKVVFRASAMAAMETGVAVTTHTHLGLNALDQIDVLTSVGLAPERIVIGHLDDGEPDLDLIREIIKRGAWAQFDDIGYEYYTERLKVQMTTDVVRAAKLLQLAEEGLAGRVILASDFGMQRHLQVRGGPGLVVLADGFRRTALDGGVPEEVLDQCMITNPATVLTML